ncbi:unnamed protein product, partial [Medioppia subpectinata]
MYKKLQTNKTQPGIGLSSPQLIQSRAVEFTYRNQILYDCRELWDQELGGKVYTGLIFVTTFIVPMFALSFLYISIGVTARHTVPGNSNGDHVQQQNRVKIVKMLVILVISFAVCWLPIQVFNMVFWLCDSCRTLSTQYQVIYFY